VEKAEERGAAEMANTQHADERRSTASAVIATGRATAPPCRYRYQIYEHVIRARHKEAMADIRYE
jgi:hypothetical protein